MGFLTMRTLMPMIHSLCRHWCRSLIQSVAFDARNSVTLIHLLPGLIHYDASESSDSYVWCIFASDSFTLMAFCLKIIINDAFDASESYLWWIYCIWFLNLITQYEGISASEWITLMQLIPITASIYRTCCIRFLHSDKFLEYKTLILMHLNPLIH